MCAHKQPVIGLIKRHGEIALHALQGPVRNRLGLADHHHDLLQVRHVCINVRPRLFELKRFRLAAQSINFIESLVGDRVNGADGACLFVVAATDIDAFVCGVVAQVVGAMFGLELRAHPTFFFPGLPGIKSADRDAAGYRGDSFGCRIRGRIAPAR
jgi:hypothetical protein